MKLVLIFCLAILGSCANQSTAQLPENSTNQNNQSNQETDYSVELEKSLKINEENVERLEAQNAKYKIVPDEFKNVDFENFTYLTTYPTKSVKLKDGEFEYEIPKYNGGGWFSFGRSYFVDLMGDEKKEAIVLLFRVDCGGSCDGGAVLLYVYEIKNRKPNAIWRYELGSAGYGCGLKTLVVN